MGTKRRTFLHGVAACMMPAALPPGALAQSAKPLKIVVGYAPGGAADLVARAVADGLRASGYTPIVENKAGASGRLATDSMLTVPADGSTLLLTPLGNLTIYPHIYKSLRYDPLKDFTGVASVAEMSFALAVGAGSPARTLQEFLALAKKDSAIANFGTPGAGTAMHFLGVMLARQSKTPLAHVPYRGGSAAMTDLIGGSLPAMITTLPHQLPVHRAGKIRILAVSTPEPIAALPGVPTFKAAGFPDLTVTESFAFVVRSGTPDPVVAQLNAAINAAVKSPSVSAALAKAEFEPPRTATPDALDKQIRAEFATWGQIVKATGYTPEE